MRFKSSIAIDPGRIAYEIKAFGAALVGVPSSVTQTEIDDAVAVLRAKYDIVELDDDGDIVVSERCKS